MYSFFFLGYPRDRRLIMDTLQKVLLSITIIGAINWGLIGLMDFNLVAYLFGEGSVFSRIVYSLVGICGLVNIGIYMAHLDYKD